MDEDSQSKEDRLRERAERLLGERRGAKGSPALRDMRDLAQELALHRAELQLQNEELHETQEQLQRARDRFGALYEHAPVGYAVLDASGIVRQANATWLELLNRTGEDLRGTPFAECLVPEDAPLFLARFRAFFRNPAEKQIVVRMLRRGATPFHARIEAQPHARLDATPTAAAPAAELLVIVSDISELQEAKERTDRLNAVLRGIRNVNQLITKEDDPQRLIQGACDNLTEALSYHNAWVALLDEAGTAVTAAASSGFAAGSTFEAHRDRLWGGTYSRCMREALAGDGRALVVDNPRADCTDCPLASLYEGRSGFVNRLTFDGRTYGVLAVSVPRTYRDDPEERALFEEVAGDLAFALHKIGMATRLRDSQNRVHSIFRSAPVGIGVVSDRVIREVNDTFCAMTGYAAEELLGQSARMVYADDAEYELVGREKYRQIRERGTGEVETRWRRKDGALRDVLLRSTPIDPADWSKGITFTALDVTEQRLAQRNYETLFREMINGFALHEMVFDAQGRPVDYRFLAVNPAFERMTGLKASDLVGKTVLDVLPQTERHWIEAYGRVVTTGAPEAFENEAKELGKWFEVTAFRPAPGQFACFVVDITERRQRDERIRMLGQMVDLAPAAITVHDYVGKFLYANRETLRMHGYADEAEFLALNLHQLDVPESAALLDERFRLIELRGGGRFEVGHYRKDGTSFPLAVLVKSIEWDGRSALLSIATDITERKQAEAALRDSEERNRLLSEVTMEGIVIHRNAVAVDVNPAVCRILGYSREELLGRNFMEFVHPDDHGTVRGYIVQSYAAPYTIRMTRRDGTTFFAEVESRDFQRNGETWRTSAIRDVSERKQAEDALRRREHLLERIFEVMPVGLWLADKEGKLLRGNPAGVRIWGAEPRVPISEYGVFRAWRLPSREPVLADDWALAKTVRTGVTIVDELLEIEAFDGKRKTILNYTAPVLDDDGSIEGAIVLNLDVSERITLEEQLRQAQKMESIGRLAGGVAHDFNNMLGAILGNTELALDSLEADHPARADLREILSATKRSAEVTRQLLAFARKQTIAPKVIDLNATVAGLLTMLRRLIGEDIDLAWLPCADLWNVKLDPSQVHQILTNLCINARDAIRDVGKVTVETGIVSIDAAYCADHAEAIPGEYVVLAVSDDGCGMDREVLAHVFEPFYTTKEVGKGTGLGLATVYGIVKQNGGFVNVYSEPGEGTSFRIYLPRHASAEPAMPPPSDHSEAVPMGRGETLLLVEDEPAILKLGQVLLDRLGYKVLVAASPEEALRLAASHGGRIDLLLTDVVMPKMNGNELAKRLRASRPNLRTLFMSGYTANAIAHHGVLDPGVSFIQKPFSKVELATKVRQSLAGDAHAQAQAYGTEQDRLGSPPTLQRSNHPNLPQSSDTTGGLP